MNRMLSFLRQLAENNSILWMSGHRDLYRQAQADFEGLLGEIIAGLAPADPSVALLEPKELIYRLNRDTRFGADKSPYRAAFRAHISPAGRAPIPGGYYLNLAPGNIFLGGGVHAEPFPDATDRIRRAIAERGEEWAGILNAPSFTENFTLTGAKLKNVPRGWDRDCPQAEYLKYKSWDIEHHLADDALEDEGAFVKRAVEKFLLLMPFNRFLNEAVRDFRYPERK